MAKYRKALSARLSVGTAAVLTVSNRDIAILGLLTAAASVVFAAVLLPLLKFCIGLGVLCLIVVAWRTKEGEPKLDPVRILASILLLLSIAAILAATLGQGGDEIPPGAPDPRHEAKPGKILSVYNKLTSGPSSMREDDRHATYLSTKAGPFCAERGCRIPGTDRESGETFARAVCQLRGERVTNGEDNSGIDDKNPGLFSSNLYYGVRLTNGVFGYVSEVWINPGDRGGLGLPTC